MCFQVLLIFKKDSICASDAYLYIYIYKCPMMRLVVLLVNALCPSSIIINRFIISYFMLQIFDRKYEFQVQLLSCIEIVERITRSLLFRKSFIGRLNYEQKIIIFFTIQFKLMLILQKWEKELFYQLHSTMALGFMQQRKQDAMVLCKKFWTPWPL